jgi:hypothetical protein
MKMGDFDKKQTSDIRALIHNKDYNGIRTALSNDPKLSNAGIPYDAVNTVKAHPLHRICDGVFSGMYTDEEAVEMAKIFLEFGADINGGTLITKQDTPLIAASSLHADRVAGFYIDNGADIHHAGCQGGTALHWAAWCGREQVVAKLIQAGAEINSICIDFQATPIFWAVHGLKSGNSNELSSYLACVKRLLSAGADTGIPNGEGISIFELLNDADLEMKSVLGYR